MKIGRSLTMLSIAISACVCADTPVITAKISSVSGFMGTMSFDDLGNMYYSQQDPVGNVQDCFYNGTNLSASLLGNDRMSLPTGSYNGAYAWFGYGSATGGVGKYRAFVGGTDISSQYLGSVNWAKTAGISAGGTAWYGKKSGLATQDVYKDGTMLTGFLGTVRQGTATGIDSAGNVLWHGYGSTNSSFDVFLNGNNISKNILGLGRMAQSAMISPNGNYVWYGYGSNTGGQDKNRAYKGTTDISGPVIGSGTNARAVLVNDAGQVAWVHYLNNIHGITDVYLDTVNISSSILGENREAWPVSLGKDGNLLWYGSGDNLDAVQDVFVNDVNVSKAALGAGRPASQALGINGQGWAIWQTPTAQGTIDIRVTMLRTKNVAGNMGLAMFTGNPQNTTASVAVREVNRGWNMGDIPVTLDANGNFNVALPVGVFDLTFKAARFLNKRLTNVDTRLAGEPIAVTLIPGDADSNNLVDLRDLNSVLLNFSASAPDLNGDGVDDLYDLNIVMTNMGARGD